MDGWVDGWWEALGGSNAPTHRPQNEQHGWRQWGEGALQIARAPASLALPPTNHTKHSLSPSPAEGRRNRAIWPGNLPTANP